MLFAACSPPIDFLPGVFLGLGLLAWSLEDRRRAFSRGWLFGLTANLLALRFVPGVLSRFTPLPLPAQWLALVLLAAAQALPWGVGALAARWLARWVPGWLAFALGIYAATFVPAVFPWTPAGGLAPWPALLQAADVIGERGVSFLVALVAGLAADAASRRARPPLAVAAALLVAMAVYGALRMRAIESARQAAPRAKIALVQPGFDAFDRWDERRASMMIERLTQLTKSAESRGAELVVWPESAYPYTLAHATRRSPLGPRAILQPGVRGPVLTGAYLQGGPGEAYNSAILATGDGAVSKPYDKRHLLWFGETVPLSDWFPFLRKAFARGAGLVPGRESVVLEVSAEAGRAPVRAAVLNCYEDTLPAAGREALEMRPNLLVNVTNDAWFEGSAEGELHLRLSALRAIETRRDLVRAVNKGPTSFVDAAGRIVARYDAPAPGSLSVIPALLETPVTLYSRVGDLPLLVLAGAALVVAATKDRGRRSRVGGGARRSTEPAGRARRAHAITG